MISKRHIQNLSNEIAMIGCTIAHIEELRRAGENVTGAGFTLEQATAICAGKLQKIASDMQDAINDKTNYLNRK